MGNSLSLRALSSQVFSHGYWDDSPDYHTGRRCFPDIHDPKSGNWPRKVGVFKPTTESDLDKHVPSDYRLFVSANGYGALLIRFLEKGMTHDFHATMTYRKDKKKKGLDRKKRRKAMADVTKSMMLTPFMLLDRRKLPSQYMDENLARLRKISWLSKEGLASENIQESLDQIRKAIEKLEQTKSKKGKRKLSIEDELSLRFRFSAIGVGNDVLKTLFELPPHDFAFDQNDLENRVIEAVSHIPGEIVPELKEGVQLPLITGRGHRDPPWKKNQAAP